ncbi:DUF374 domain-containing protein [Bosea sp. (in: a-proteobacteria)]|uniref:lysophospholipid acyltransferase family protein n=1 Tax=Bosea sp. (in: a-proteobacteria) TaxID=1871050 RepID=UPI001ACAA5C3|nr:DUF374 domain-containing protein [Bosea sp. (in: a-proteobacteria)]MBN9442449.1 DUF374 domain-containing protein [Bosea sp. (in: a-proteobacteria)]
MLSRSGPSTALAGRALHAYLGFLRRTTRFKPAIPGARPWERASEPFIAMTWHGQRMLSLAALNDASRLAILTSRGHDGGPVAYAVRKAGFRTIHCSSSCSRVAWPGGVRTEVRHLRNALRDGTSIVLTARTAEDSLAAGRGAVQLARLSGRPIYLFAAMTSARFDHGERNRTSIALPFGRGCILWSEPLYVRKGADGGELQLIALDIAERLDDLHASACRSLLRSRRI